MSMSVLIAVTIIERQGGVVVIFYCPACARCTMHKQRYKHYIPEDDEGGSYYLCTVCHRTRRISQDELAELLYAAGRRVDTYLQEAM